MFHKGSLFLKKFEMFFSNFSKQNQNPVSLWVLINLVFAQIKNEFYFRLYLNDKVVCRFIRMRLKITERTTLNLTTCAVYKNITRMQKTDTHERLKLSYLLHQLNTLFITTQKHFDTNDFQRKRKQVYENFKMHIQR